MKVCQCDRCGKIFSPSFENNAFISRVIETGMETFGLEETEASIDNSFDICANCYDDFIRWMTNPNTYWNS